VVYFNSMRHPRLRSAVPLVAVLLIAHSAAGQTWSTGYFNTSDGYGPTGTSLNGAPTNAPANEQWQTTDPFSISSGRGATSLMGFIDGWSYGLSNSGNQSVYFGGYNVTNGVLPGIANPFLYREFNHTFGTAATTFSADFGIVGPSTNLSLTYTNNDAFGFNLTATNGISLAAFQFDPTGASPGFLKVNWIQNGTNAVTNGTTFNGLQIQYDALYRLTATLVSNSVSMEIAALQPQGTSTNQITGIVSNITNYAVGSSFQVINGGGLSGGLQSSDFEVAGMTWDLKSGDTNTPGANYMIVNQVSVVPEPSSLVLFAVGSAVLGLGAWVRRRK